MMIHGPDHVKIEFVEMKRLRCGNGELHCKYEKASDALPCKVSEAFLSSHEADSGRKGLSSGEPLAILKKTGLQPTKEMGIWHAAWQRSWRS